MNISFSLNSYDRPKIPGRDTRFAPWWQRLGVLYVLPSGHSQEDAELCHPLSLAVLEVDTKHGKGIHFLSSHLMLTYALYNNDYCICQTEQKYQVHKGRVLELENLGSDNCSIDFFFFR